MYGGVQVPGVCPNAFATLHLSLVHGVVVVCIFDCNGLYVGVVAFDAWGICGCM